MTDKEDFSIISRDGTQLEGYEYLMSEPMAMVCMIHGFAEYSGRYEHVAQFFGEQNMSFFILDMRGHGHSEGKRGHVSSFGAYLDDVEELMMHARATHNETPMFLYGHSMGGSIVANFCLKRNTSELKGAILSSPWLKLAIEVPEWKVKLARVVAKFWPSLTQPSEFSPNQLTNDEELNQVYAGDPQVLSRISIRLFCECSDSGEWVLKNSDRLKLPLLLFHGADDEIISAEASQEFAESRRDLITFSLLSETKHEPHNDLKKLELFEKIWGWLKENITNR